MNAPLPQAFIRTAVPVRLDRGHDVDFITFDGLADGHEHIALRFPGWQKADVPLVRVHSACLTGDVFNSQQCDCGAQLTRAQDIMAVEGGIILYMAQEGRGIGLYNKLHTYDLQRTQGLDTFEANRRAGFPDDARDFGAAAQMLRALGIPRIMLLSNNPHKQTALEAAGIAVDALRPIGTFETDENRRYLTAKRKQKGHLL